MLGCAEAQVDLEAERAALLELDRAWADAEGEGEDVEQIVSYWTDDAVVIPPGEPPVVGKDALRAMIVSSLDVTGFAASWETEEVHLSPDGRMAYLVGTNRFTGPNAEGNLVTTHGRGVTVWRKRPDGQWKCVMDIWNDAPPADQDG